MKNNKKLKCENCKKEFIDERNLNPAFYHICCPECEIFFMTQEQRILKNHLDKHFASAYERAKYAWGFFLPNYAQRRR